MSVTGVFAADFASFFDACKKAEVSLKSFEAGAAKVEGQLNRMVDNFSGRKVIQEATLMAEAIERGGGVTRLTTAELARAGATANEAAEKMKLLGLEVPENLQAVRRAVREVGDESEASIPRVGGLKGELQKFDGILSSMGINISGPIKAIGELGDFAGKSVTEIGLLGTAGAAMGAGFAGWKVGRMVAEFFDLDTKIANATSRLMGYGDVAAQTAGAKQDVINRAIAQGAHATISYTDAIKFNIEAMKRSTAAADDQERELTELEKAWNATIETTGWAADEGTIYGDVVDGINKVTGEAIAMDEAYRSTLKFTTEVIAEQADSLEILADKKKADAAATKEAAKAAAEAMKVFSQTFSSDVPQLTGDQLAQLRGSGGDERLWERLDALENKSTASRRGLYEGVVTREQYQAATEQATLLAQLQKWAEGRERPPGFAGGVENFAGGLAYVHRDEMLVNLPSGTDVIPAGRMGGGGGSSIVTNITINGSVLGNKEEIARVVGDAVMSRMRGQGFRAPVGA